MFIVKLLLHCCPKFKFFPISPEDIAVPCSLHYLAFILVIANMELNVRYWLLRFVMWFCLFWVFFPPGFLPWSEQFSTGNSSAQQRSCPKSSPSYSCCPTQGTQDGSALGDRNKPACFRHTKCSETPSAREDQIPGAANRAPKISKCVWSFWP